jgi:hypothetical protein
MYPEPKKKNKNKNTEQGNKRRKKRKDRTKFKQKDTPESTERRYYGNPTSIQMNATWMQIACTKQQNKI